MANNKDKAARRLKRIAKERQRADARAQLFLRAEEKDERLKMYENFAAMVREIRELNLAVARYVQEDIPAYDAWIRENFPAEEQELKTLAAAFEELNDQAAMTALLARKARQKPEAFARAFLAALPAETDLTAALKEACARELPGRDLRRLARPAAADAPVPAPGEFSPEQVDAVLATSREEVFLNPANQRRTVEKFFNSMRDNLMAVRKHHKAQTVRLSWGFAALDAAGREELRAAAVKEIAEKKTVFEKMNGRIRALFAAAKEGASAGK